MTCAILKDFRNTALKEVVQLLMNIKRRKNENWKEDTLNQLITFSLAQYSDIHCNMVNTFDFIKKMLIYTIFEQI